MGALSFSPSPITTTPSIWTLSRIRRMASTAAPSADSFSPLPIQRDAARAAASVTRTSSRARLRSGAEEVRVASLIGSSFQAVQHALGGGAVEQDRVHLGEEGQAQVGVGGQAADVERGLDALDRHPSVGELLERGDRLAALADQLAVQAVTSPEARDQDVPQAGQPARGLDAPPERDHQPLKLQERLGEERRLRVAV